MGERQRETDLVHQNMFEDTLSAQEDVLRAVEASVNVSVANIRSLEATHHTDAAIQHSLSQSVTAQQKSIRTIGKTLDAGRHMQAAMQHSVETQAATLDALGKTGKALQKTIKAQAHAIEAQGHQLKSLERLRSGVVQNAVGITEVHRAAGVPGAQAVVTKSASPYGGSLVRLAILICLALQGCT